VSTLQIIYGKVLSRVENLSLLEPCFLIVRRRLSTPFQVGVLGICQGAPPPPAGPDIFLLLPTVFNNFCHLKHTRVLSIVLGTK